MRFRLFPILIVAVTVMLTVKLGALWYDVSSPGTAAIFEKSSAFAQTDNPTPPTLGDENTTGEDEPFELGADAEGEDIPEGMLPAETVDSEEDFSDVSNLSSGEIRLLHDLAKRRKELNVKERRIEEREALLRAAEQQIIEKQNALSVIKLEIESLLAQYDTALDAENQRLINVYSNMKPKSASAIFNEMDMDTLMIIIRGMKERKIAPILAAMNTDKVRLVSKELASDKGLPNLPQ